MGKELKNYKTNSIIMIGCMTIFILANITNIISNIIPGIYFILYLIGFIYGYIKREYKIVMICAISFIIYSIVEPFLPVNFYDASLRVALLFNFIGSILNIISSIKLMKEEK